LWISKENGEMKIICCKEHAELAIDIIVDEFETAPVVELLTGKDELSTTCEYCKEPGVYKVSNI
jgi:CxxH/CxxC protein (TIGR04129 family)